MKIYRVHHLNLNIVPVYDQTICYCDSEHLAQNERHAYCQDYFAHLEDVKISEVDVITDDNPGRSYLKDLFGLDNKGMKIENR